MIKDIQEKMHNILDYNTSNKPFWFIVRNDGTYETEKYIIKKNGTIIRNEILKSDKLDYTDIVQYSYLFTRTSNIISILTDTNEFYETNRITGKDLTCIIYLKDLDNNEYKFTDDKFKVYKRYLDKKGSIILNSIGSEKEVTFDGYSIGYYGIYTIDDTKNFKISIRMDTNSTSISRPEFAISITPNFTFNCKAIKESNVNKKIITDLVTIHKGSTYKFELR